jgi:hypothetical protein
VDNNNTNISLLGFKRFSDNDTINITGKNNNENNNSIFKGNNIKKIINQIEDKNNNNNLNNDNSGNLHVINNNIKGKLL